MAGTITEPTARVATEKHSGAVPADWFLLHQHESTNMKFRFYITDLNNGLVSGTNDRDLAADVSLSEDFFVVDSETGMWLSANGDQVDIQDFE